MWVKDQAFFAIIMGALALLAILASTVLLAYKKKQNALIIHAVGWLAVAIVIAERSIHGWHIRWTPGANGMAMCRDASAIWTLPMMALVLSVPYFLVEILNETDRTVRSVVIMKIAGAIVAAYGLWLINGYFFLI